MSAGFRANEGDDGDNSAIVSECIVKVRAEQQQQGETRLNVCAFEVAGKETGRRDVVVSRRMLIRMAGSRPKRWLGDVDAND